MSYRYNTGGLCLWFFSFVQMTMEKRRQMLLEMQKLRFLLFEDESNMDIFRYSVVSFEICFC